MRARRLAFVLALVATGAAGCFYPDYAFDLADDAGQGGAAGGTGGNGGEAGTTADAQGEDAPADSSIDKDAASEDAKPDVSNDTSADQTGDITADTLDEDGASETSDENTGDVVAETTDEADALLDDADAGGDDAPADVSVDSPDAADAQDAADEADVKDATADDAASEPDAPPPEICNNNKDDNGDGLVDCADPQCGAFSCVATAPSGWTGPFALYDGLSSNPVPGCPTSYSTTPVIKAYAQLSAPPAQCSTCTCSSYANVSCSVPNLDLWDNSGSCGSGCIWQSVSLSPANSCIGMDFGTSCVNGPPAEAHVYPSTASGGSCTPSQQNPSFPPYSWAESAQLCQTSKLGGGCTTGNTCAPLPTGQYQQTLCVLSQAGAISCPSGAYSVKHWFYQSVADTRSCTPCGCGTPQNVSCTGAVEFFPDSDTTCGTTPLASVSTNTACGGVSGGAQKMHLKYVPNAPSGGACGPTGGNAQGTVVPNQAITVCCTQ